MMMTGRDSADNNSVTIMHGYSWLSARIGSIRVARIAGTRLAASPAPIRTWVCQEI